MWSLSASSWSGTMGPSAVCLGASSARGGCGCLCLCAWDKQGDQWSRAMTWVHDPPSDVSYWRHPQRVCVLVCMCVCVHWCVWWGPMHRCQQLGWLKMQDQILGGPKYLSQATREIPTAYIHVCIPHQQANIWISQRGEQDEAVGASAAVSVSVRLHLCGWQCIYVCTCVCYVIIHLPGKDSKLWMTRG